MSEDKPTTAAELCLFLIMSLPEIEDRKQHVRDFCALYDIKEKSPPYLRQEEESSKQLAGIGRIINK